MARGERHARRSRTFIALLSVCFFGSGLAQQAVAGANAVALHRTFAVNPPGCASEIASIINRLTNLAVGVVIETRICAQARGWSGQSISGDRRISPAWHNQRLCATSILSTISEAIQTFSDSFAAAFDCFNSNQGCAQSITSAMASLTDAATDLSFAWGFCARPGDFWFLNSDSDAVLAGLSCWKFIWSSITNIVEASKFIDTTIATCAPEDPVPVPAPAPAPGAAAAPGTAAAVAGTAAAVAGTGALPTGSAANPFTSPTTSTPKPGTTTQDPSQRLGSVPLGAAPTQEDVLADAVVADKAWEDFEQPPMPFAMQGVDQDLDSSAVERRLLSAKVDMEALLQRFQAASPWEISI